MHNLESQILDVYDEVELPLQKLASALPRALHSVPMANGDDLASRQDHEFALVCITKHANKLRKYPVKTASEIALSAAYLDENYTKLPEDAAVIAAKNIKMAADKQQMKVPPSVEKLAGMKAKYYSGHQGYLFVESHMDKTAAPVVPENTDAVKTASAFALGTKYPIDTPENIKKAAQYFDTFAEYFPFEERVTYAKNTVEAAKTAGISLGQTKVAQYAGLGKYASWVEAELVLRTQYCAVEKTASAYRTLLSKVRTGEVTPEVCAQALESIDKTAGLNIYWDSAIRNPREAVFSALSEASFGKIAAPIDLQDQGKRGLVEDYFGKELAGILEKEGASAYQSLPKDAQEILAAIQSGEIPCQ